MVVEGDDANLNAASIAVSMMTRNGASTSRLDIRASRERDSGIRSDSGAVRSIGQVDRLNGFVTNWRAHPKLVFARLRGRAFAKRYVLQDRVRLVQEKGFKDTRGFRIFLAPSDAVVSWSILREGVWEPGVTKVVEGHTKGGVFFDVGSCFGWHTLVALSGGASRVHSFEPHPTMFQLLSKNAETNGYRDRCVLNQRCVGDENGPVTFYLTDSENAGLSSLTRKTSIPTMASCVTLDR